MVGRVPRRIGVTCGVALALVAVVTAEGTGQEDSHPTVDAETAQEMLSSVAREGGWWQVSNAEYRARNDALPDFYAMRYELGPTGYSATGCMWGGRDGETEGPYWTFFNAWDPTEEALIVFQVNPAGFAAIGHAWTTGGEDREEEAIQTMGGPGRPLTRFRHLNTMPHPDTLVTRSFNWEDGEWVPRRHDTWVWTPAEGREQPAC